MQLCIKKHLLPVEERGSEPGLPAHHPDDTVQFSKSPEELTLPWVNTYVLFLK